MIKHTPVNVPKRSHRSLSDWIRWLRCRLRGPGTCDIRFTLQGRYASVLDLRTFGIKNTAVTIHGSALLAGAGITEKEFISVKSDEMIEEALSSYLENRQIHPGRKDLLILDMEPRYPDPHNPNGWISFAPKDLGSYEGLPPIQDGSNPSPIPNESTIQEQLINAYIRRLKVARRVLQKRYPTVRLGLYGVVVPMGRGQVNEAFEKRMRAYEHAGQLGMYDDTDYLVPVLYNGFGCSDVPLPNENCDTAKLHEWIERATRRAISSTEQLGRTNHTRIPLAPILTFWVNNGRSAHNSKVIRPETMSVQLRILQEYCSVDTILLWSGSETSDEMDGTDWESFDIPKFLEEVDALPLPGCA